MREQYTGNFRTKLPSDIRKIFKEYALKEGSVVKVHDRLMLEYIAKKEEEARSEGRSTRN